MSAHSVESKIASRTTVYLHPACQETTPQKAGSGKAFTCHATTGSGATKVGAGKDATILVAQTSNGLVATVFVGGQLVDFFTLD